MNRPGVPATEFVPAAPEPGHPVGRSLWGIALRSWAGTVLTTELLDPDDLEVVGRRVGWYPADDGSGVLYGRAMSHLGYSLAVARAVPLS